MNFRNPKIQELIKQKGLVGLGAYVMIKEIVENNPRKSSSVLNVSQGLSGLAETDLILWVLKSSGLFYSFDGATYYSESERKQDVSVEDAYRFFDKSGLRGRFFSKMQSVHVLTEADLMALFEKWKSANELTRFTDDRHLENSFNKYILTNRGTKPKQSINWDQL